MPAGPRATTGATTPTPVGTPAVAALVALAGTLAAVMHVVPATLAAQDFGTPSPTSFDLSGLAEASPGDPLPPGWQFRAVGEAAPTSVEVVRDTSASTGSSSGRARQAAAALVFEATAGQAGQYWRALEEPLDAAGGTLRWRWRVDDAVPEADLLDPERDDAPARLFVVFGDGGLFSPPRVLFYSWAGDTPSPEMHLSHVDDRLAVVPLRSAASDPLGVWLDEARDPAEDYRTAFGEEPNDPITAVGFMLDTDQTLDRAKSALAKIEWLPRRR